MTPLQFIAIAIAGGLGACLRFLVDEFILLRLRADVPWGVLLINLSGSFLLGLVTGLSAGLVAETAHLVVTIAGVGFLGGYTTFGTASVATVRLVSERKLLAALITGPGMLVLSIAFAAVGWAIAATLV